MISCFVSIRGEFIVLEMEKMNQIPSSRNFCLEILLSLISYVMYFDALTFVYLLKDDKGSA